MTEQVLIPKQQMLKRECDSCTLCCTISQVPQLQKPAYTECKHQHKTKGCTIYNQAEMPISCKQFYCDWIGGIVPEELKPDKCGVYLVADGNRDRVYVYVDKARPDAWKQELMGQFLNELSQYAYLVVMVGDERQIAYNGDDPQIMRKLEAFCQRFGLPAQYGKETLAAAIKKKYN